MTLWSYEWWVSKNQTAKRARSGEWLKRAEAPSVNVHKGNAAFSFDKPKAMLSRRKPIDESATLPKNDLVPKRIREGKLEDLT